MEFNAFPKIPRLNQEIIITEKIDGINASIELVSILTPLTDAKNIIAAVGDLYFFAGSRARYITPENDNQGFARWVKENAEELVKLGPGQHFGEWWGKDIQRGYGLAEKRFSLFNTTRGIPEVTPACCSVVPELYRGPFNTNSIDQAMNHLRNVGSLAAPGFMKPEGVVILHTGRIIKYLR